MCSFVWVQRHQLNLIICYLCSVVYTVAAAGLLQADQG